MNLCFGTFTGVLNLCGVKGLKKTKLLHTIVQSVDGTCELSSSAVTWLMQCTANLPNDNRSNSKGAVITKAQESEPYKVAEYFSKKVIPLIDPNKRKLAVLALCDIVKNDESIQAGTVMDIVSGITKNALREQSKFSLANFLSGVFLYTTTVENKTNKEAVEFITADYIKSFINVQNKIAFIVPQGENDIDTVIEAFNAYLVNAKDKYGSLKTLLYKDHPKLFYSFYIPNDVEHSVGREKGSMIYKVTVKKLTSMSNFLILNGEGGLGKSMMMRHLLLDAINTFKDFCRVPIFIALKEYKGTGTLINFIYIKAAELNANITKAAVESALNDGMFLLLFDGMDEIKAEWNTKFERELESFTDKYPKNLYVISSRPYQSFISFSRFTVLRIKPFTQEQSLRLIDRLEFRPDEPVYKQGFRTLIQGALYHTHQSFIENPLLLTIMLMIYEKSGKIPDQMHIFYRKAYITLYEDHDATKGGFVRASKTGFSMDTVADYFSEFCFRTYNDYMFEYTADEFSRYYSAMIANDGSAPAADFLYDLCVNLCLMYMEGSKYHYIHRTFQEYFCALFFSRQKDNFLERLGDFFENRQKQTRSDNVLRMLYDMVPVKVEECIFIPYLQKLFDECDEKNGYWTFLEKMYACIRYDVDDVLDYSTNAPASFLFDFITRLNNPVITLYCDALPEDDSLVVREYAYIQTDENSRELVDIKKIPEEYPWYQDEAEVVGGTYEFEVAFVRSRSNGYAPILDVLDNDDFIYKSEYLSVRRYLETIKRKQSKTDDLLLALL
jgi:hypothetical protein